MRARTPAQKAAHAARMRAWAMQNRELSRQRCAADYIKHREARLASQRIRYASIPPGYRAAIERARYHAKRAAAALIQPN